MSHEGGEANEDLSARNASREADNGATESCGQKFCGYFRWEVEPESEDAVKCKRCDKNAAKDCCGHCKACFNKMLKAQQTMELATGVPSKLMTVYQFADLFKSVLFSLFEK